MSTKERLAKLAEMLKQKSAKKEVEKKEEKKEDKKDEKKEKKSFTMTKEQRERVAKKIALKKKLAELKEKQAQRKKAVDADSVLDNAENVIDESKMNENYKNSEPGQIAGDFADKGDLNKAKEEAIDQLPPTVVADDVRSAYRKALRLAYKRFNKNLDKQAHEIKSSLYEKLTAYGVKHNAAVAIIEASFEESGDKFIDAVMKRADEVADYSDEGLAELENTLEVTMTINPDGTVEGEYEVEDEEAEFDEEVEGIEEKLVEGSFKLPKTASSNKQSLLGKAMPGYRTPGSN